MAFVFLPEEEEEGGMGKKKGGRSGGRVVTVAKDNMYSTDVTSVFGGCESITLVGLTLLRRLLIPCLRLFR